jgi:hypothetical protein
MEGIIEQTASRISIDKKLVEDQKQKLKTVLFYIHKDGATKFLEGKLFKSQHLMSLHHKNLLTSDHVLSEFVKKLSRSEPESVNNIINHYIDKLKEISRKSQKSRDERKSNRSSMLFENTRYNYAPPSEDGSFPGGPKYLKSRKHFKRLQERDSTTQSPHKKTRIGGKRTKHKKHNIKKTRRRYK